MYLMLLPLSSSLVMKGFRSLGIVIVRKRDVVILTMTEIVTHWEWLILVFLQLLLRFEKLGKEIHWKEPSCLFSCEGAALEVLMSVCVSVCGQVKRFLKVPEGTRRYQKVPEGSWMILKVPEGSCSFREWIFFIFLNILSWAAHKKFAVLVFEGFP